VPVSRSPVTSALPKGLGARRGLLRCGVCGYRMGVAYGGPQGRITRYRCRGAERDYSFGESCFTFGGFRIEEEVGREMLRVLSPIGVAATAEAREADQREESERRRQIQLALESARYEASRAHRQYDAVDPTNRLVAGDLESRWNARLADVQRLEADLAVSDTVHHKLTAEQQVELLRLGADLEVAWTSPAATSDLKKRILRTLIREIVVRPNSDALEVVVHWQGGEHTVLAVARTRPGQRRIVTDGDTAAAITALARILPDESIAATKSQWATKCTWKDLDTGPNLYLAVKPWRSRLQVR
jgi:hypothetical protein